MTERAISLGRAVGTALLAVLLIALHFSVLGVFAPALATPLFSAWPGAPELEDGVLRALACLLLLLLMGWHYRVQRKTEAASLLKTVCNRLVLAVGLATSALLIAAWIYGAIEWSGRDDARSALPLGWLTQAATILGLAALWPRAGFKRLRAAMLLLAILSLIFAACSVYFGWQLDYESWLRRGMPDAP